MESPVARLAAAVATVLAVVAVRLLARGIRAEPQAVGRGQGEARARKRRSAGSRQRRAGGEIRATPVGLADDEVCVVCFEGPKEMVPMAHDSCGHICACAVCAKSLRECPICRGAASHWIKVRSV